MSAVLRTERLSVSYGGVRALVDVDLAVAEGQLVGLIGPNGAGKTTFIDAAGGFTRSSGSVVLQGKDVSRLPPHRRARRGLARTWQGADLFEDLTVRENLRVAGPEVEPALAQLGIEHLADRSADELSQGERKLVGVARALASTPRVVCLDEPAAGLDSDESRDLGARLREIVDGGVALLLVDHDMGLVLSICDHVVVLDFGKVIARGAPEQIRDDQIVIEAYLGQAAEQVEAGLT
jgi:branched-chain amino acid transport system ATP-binding protein